MGNFQNTFKSLKRSFISAFSICMTVPSSSAYFILFELNRTSCLGALTALSINSLGKYLFFSAKGMFIFETKLVCYFNLLYFIYFLFISSNNLDVLEL